MVVQKKALMINFFLKKFIYFFNRFIPNGISPTNQHVLMLDGHGISPVTFKTMKQKQGFGLDI
jgi:hypothetical protein